MRWNSDGERSWIEYEPDPRHAELIVKSLKLESAKGVTTPPFKKKAGRCVDDISAVGRIADETVSKRDDESRVYVAGQARSVLFDERVGMRHAEADGTIDD